MGIETKESNQKAKLKLKSKPGSPDEVNNKEKSLPGNLSINLLHSQIVSID